MLKYIIAVLIGNFIFWGMWILFTGFTVLKTKTILDDNPKGASARESSSICDCGEDCC